MDFQRLLSFKGAVSRACALALILTLLAGCAARRVPETVEKRPTPETEEALARFEEADRLLREQSYSQALVIYQDYLRDFPKGPLADKALRQIGLLYTTVQSYGEARSAFDRLLSEFPKSRYAEDARYGLALAQYKEGALDTALESAQVALQRAETPEQTYRIRNLMGFIYSAKGEFGHAVESYTEAYESAQEPRRTEVLNRVKELVDKLEESDLQLLLENYGQDPPGAYIRLRLARIYASEDRFEEARDLLSEFVALFPDHEDREAALTLMRELEARAKVNRFLLGCLLPLSGPYASIGNRALTGIEFALSEFNARPGVQPIELLIKDTKGDPKTAEEAVEALALTEGVIGIIGPMITSEAAAVKAQELQVPILTLTQKPDVPKLGEYVFRNFLTASLQVRTVVRYAVEDLGLRTFAILYPDEPYGVSFMNHFWDAVLLYGGRVVGVEPYSPEQTDFSDPIKKLVGLHYPRLEEPAEEAALEEIIKQFPSAPLEPSGQGEAMREEEDELDNEGRRTPSEPERSAGDEDEIKPIVDFEAIFIPDSYEKVGLIAPQLSYHDVKDVLLLGTNLWHSEQLITMASGYVQGAVIPDGFFLESPSPQVRSFVERYLQVFGSPPAYLEAQAYDSALMLFEALSREEVRSRLSLRRALAQMEPFAGVTGLSVFDEDGDVSKDLFLLKVQGNRFVQIKP